MQIVPIWDAIETILKADALTKEAIKRYEQGALEQAGYQTPLCIIGARAKMDIERLFLSDASGARSFIQGGITTISILAQAYKDRHAITLAKLDTIQHNITTVLNTKSNRTLGGTVMKSVTGGVEYINMRDNEANEYLGFMLFVRMSIKE